MPAPPYGTGGKMRIAAIIVVLGSCTVLAAQQAAADKLGKRYGFEVNQDFYSQKSPQDALKSVARALERQRIAYLLAQLADPEFVDKRVEEYRGYLQGKEEAKTVLAFDRLIKETQEHFLEDPGLLRELQRFAKEAKDEDWKIEEK